MSLIDKIASKVMPLASEEDRAKARGIAEGLAGNNDWLAQVIDHHKQIERAFAGAMAARDTAARKDALRRLGELLTGHSNAEEAVLYPAVVEHSGKSHAAMAYEQQAGAKVEMAMLEELDPSSEEWCEKLEHVQSAVQQHVYQEENEWFPDVARNAPLLKQSRLTDRYREEYGRYMAGGDAPGRPAISQTV